MAKVSAQELAELVPCSLDYVLRPEGLGILEAEDERFPRSDVHVVRLMAAFERAGISLEDVARGIAGGALSFPLGMFMPDSVGLSETYAGLGERVGRTPHLLRRLSRELGLPPSSDDRVRAEDAEVLALIVDKLDLADDEELSRFARLYGGSVQRLVASGLQFFDLAVRSGRASWRSEESCRRSRGSRPRSRSWISPGTRHLRRTEETRRRQSWPRISRASYRRRRRNTAAGRSSGWATASCSTSPTRAGPSSAGSTWSSRPRRPCPCPPGSSSTPGR